MTDDEKQSVECLRLDEADIAGLADAANDGDVLSIKKEAQEKALTLSTSEALYALWI